MVRPTNLLWNYFVKEVRSGVGYGVCIACQDALKLPDGSTGSIRHHLKSRHPLKFAEMQRLQAESQRQKTDELLVMADAQKELNSVMGKSNYLLIIF